MITAKPEIRAFFDEPTNTVSCLVWDPATKEGAIIDPVLNFDLRTGEATVKSADAKLAEANKLGVMTKQVLETHAHADHLSAAPYNVEHGPEDALHVLDMLYQAQDRREGSDWRADFPGGNAHQLYCSIKRILSLPDETRLFMCHDYKAPGRDHYAWETTVGEEKTRNVHVHEGVTGMNL